MRFKSKSFRVRWFVPAGNRAALDGAEVAKESERPRRTRPPAHSLGAMGHHNRRRLVIPFRNDLWERREYP